VEFTVQEETDPAGKTVAYEFLTFPNDFGPASMSNFNGVRPTGRGFQALTGSSLFKKCSQENTPWSAVAARDTDHRSAVNPLDVLHPNPQ
jgi:hypothetical protein